MTLLTTPLNIGEKLSVVEMAYSAGAFYPFVNLIYYYIIPNLRLPRPRLCRQAGL